MPEDTGISRCIDVIYPNFKFRSRLTGQWRRCQLVLLLAAVLTFSLQAQESDSVGLAGSAHLAATLSEPALRTDTLLTMIAVERMLDYAALSHKSDVMAWDARFRNERAWLDRLAKQYLELPSRGSQLDPAAWFVLLELDQHQMSPGPSISPLGPGNSSLMRQLFDRADERLAATILPEVLHRMEYRSVGIWQKLLEEVSSNETLYALVTSLNTDWFLPWTAVQAPVSEGQEEPVDVISESLDSLMVLADSTMLAGPPDTQRLKRLRFNLLSALPALEDVQASDAAYLLTLATAIDGLREGKYLAFTESLLWVVSDLLLAEIPALPAVPGQPPALEPMPQAQAEPLAEAAAVPEMEPAGEEETPQSLIPRALSDLLPGLSNSFANDFSEVDPRINANLATVFDAFQYLQSGQADPSRLSALRKDLANAVAQFVLLLPEMVHYYEQPVRRRISEEINICISIMANHDPDGVTKLTREQFDACLESMIELTEVLVSREDLAGDMEGPFGTEQLRRELRVPPWQRINFALGYLHEQYPTACELPASPLPNPLEWASLANLMVWFASQSPVYFQTPENEALIVRMRQQGMDLLQGMFEQVDCISGVGTGIGDPVVRSMAGYRDALDNLVAALREAELGFRESRLKAGADVVLHGDASQQTAYRPEDLIIGPCNTDTVCEMAGELEATRALIGLFPDPYLIADQAGLGEIEICYDNMLWVNRRAEPVREDDAHVANYFGHLSFDLIGRYREKGEVRNVFGSNFMSPDEYHYLFAGATDEVREDSCPTEWIGTKIVTGLNSRNSIRVVPDRLTYLASARNQPSTIINANWDRGAEWRDWFVTGLGITPHEYPQDEGIYDRVNQYLQAQYQAQQSELYTALLRPLTRAGRSAPDSLFDLQQELTARKALVRTYISLFYPEFIIDSDEIRGSMEGYGSLLDTMVLRRFREANVAVSSINETGLSRLEQFQANWGRQPETVRRSGSIATSVAHALMRLNDLYIEFFTENEIMTPAGLRG